MKKERKKIHITAGIILIRSLGSVGNLILYVVISRLALPEVMGIVASTLAVGFIFGNISALGLNKLAIKEISPIYKEVYSLDVIRLFVAARWYLIVFYSLFCLLVLRSFNYFSIGIIIGVVIGQNLIAAEILKSIKKPNTGLLVEVILFPCLAVLFVLAASQYVDLTAEVCLLILILSSILTWVLSLINLGKVTGDIVNKSIFFWDYASIVLSFFWEKKAYLLIYTSTAVVLVLGGRLPIAISPEISGAKDVANISIIITFGTLGGTIIHALQSIYAPKMASGLYSDNISLVKQLYRETQISCFLLFAPITAFVLIWPEVLFKIYGVNPDQEVKCLLVVVVLAQHLRLSSGCSEALLALTNKGRHELILNVTALTCMIIFLLVTSAHNPLYSTCGSFALYLLAKGLLGYIFVTKVITPKKYT